MVPEKDLNIHFQNTTTDLYSKGLILKAAYAFYFHPSKNINRKDLKIAKGIVDEIEEWEIEYGKKKFSVLKNDAVLVGYLACKFGELVGLNQEELSDVYISGLIQSIGKVYLCDDDKKLAYENLNSPLNVGDEGFESVEKYLKKIPSKTEKYLRDNTEFKERIIDTASNFHFVYSKLFKDERESVDISQLNTVLWFANSLSALSFSSLEELERSYKKGSYVSLIEAFELLKSETQDFVPHFWSKTSSATLMSLVFTMIIGMSSSSKAEAANYSSQEIIALTNNERSSRGLNILVIDEKLMDAAVRKARDMFDRQYWSHYGPSGESPWVFISQEGYSYKFAGENIAKGFSDVEKLNEAWIDSPEHKANILKPEYEEIGVAVMDGTLEGKLLTVVVQIFGKEKESQVFSKAEASEKEEEKIISSGTVTATVTIVDTQEEDKLEKKIVEENSAVENLRIQIEEIIKKFNKEEISMLRSFVDFLERTRVNIRDRIDRG